MKKTRFAVLVSLVLVCILAAGAMLNASAAGSLSAEEIDSIINTTTDSSLVTSPFTAAVAAVRDSVVLVNNYAAYRSYGYGGWGSNGGSGEALYGTGSGTVVSEYGHVLTNYHVVEDATRVTVSDGEKEYEATVVGADEVKDLAVLLCPGLDLPAVELGDSDQLQEGEWAIVIGNPLGEDFFRSTTVGVVSSLERSVETQTTDKYGRRNTVSNEMIQVDAAINSGNSGGGMFNVLGQLMGIPSMKYTSSYFSSTSIDNIGMCIPINVAKPLIREALEKYNADEVDAYLTEKQQEEENRGGAVATDMTDKPRLGVTIRTLDAGNTAVTSGVLPRGCIVWQVESGSPAEQAGILAGDIIVEIDGVVITDTASLQAQLLPHASGDAVQVKLYRTETNLLEAQYLSEIGEGDYLDVTVVLQIIQAPAA
ncbi:MAG: trypsin-like peptidase domain-containing protein [Clostridia bacterium]|nr:trypsin-like peptidase domain-containing protein [Clostridia bacterium]